MNLTFGNEQNPLNDDQYWALMRVRLAERFHWTLDYIDSHLTQDDVLIIGAITEADDKRKPKKELP